MSLKIKNLRLNKIKYIYWIDTEIKLSFEIESNENDNIDKISIIYWYNFYWRKQKHNAFQDKIIEENRKITLWINEKFSFILPINFFNLDVEDWITDIKIENYIIIKIKNSLFSKSITEKLSPIIMLDQKFYGLENLDVSSNLNLSYNLEYSSNNIHEIEKYISKNNDEEYIKLIDEIEKKELDLIKVTGTGLNKAALWKEEEYLKISNEIKKLLDKKINLFIIKSDKEEEYNKLIAEKENLDYNFENFDGISFNEYSNLLNEANSLQRNIYKCYSSKNEMKYESIINDFYDKIYIENYNNADFSLSNIYSKFNRGEKIEKKEWDFIKIKKYFTGIIWWWFDNILEEDSLFADFVHKDIYNDLKKDPIINIFDKLVNSKIYNFIYKYIFIFPVIVIISLMFNEFIYNLLPDYLISYYFLFFLFFPIFFILFSKLLEQLFKFKLNNGIYDYKLLSNKEIENNLKNNLFNWNLKITDIFEKFNLKVNESKIDYNFYVSLDLNVWTFHQEWKHISYHNYNIYNIGLFNYTWKWYFDFNKIHLLRNNYDKLLAISPNSNKKAWTKVYYTLNYKFDSSYLPDIDWSMNLYLNFL